MDALEIKDDKSLESWLEDKPVEWSQLIALRAALRVFPLVLADAGRTDDALQPRIQRLTLAVWRCLLISSVARKYPTDEMRTAARTAARAAAAAAARAAAAADADAADAASASARAAAYVAARTAASAAADAAARAVDAAAAWETVSSDCQILERIGPKPLEKAPLWLEHQPAPNGEAKPVIATPLWAEATNASLANDLADLLGPDAELIAEWYRPLLAGDATAAWSLTFLGERARKLALRKDAFWTVTERREAETIMEDIAAALEWEKRNPWGLDPEPMDLESMSEFIIRYVENASDPVSIDMIRARFDQESYLYVDSTLRRELGTLARTGQIKRVRRGWYAGSDYGVQDETSPIPNKPPPFGKQGAGAKLGIVGGVVSLALPDGASTDGNDYERIGKFLPLAREAIDELLASLPEPTSDLQNDPHFRLRRKAKEYLRYSEAPLEKLDFELLFGIGTILQNRLAAAEKPSLEPDLAPLTDRQKTALMDFRSTHGPMITASSAALELMKDADEFERNPEREREYREVSAEFVEEFAQAPHVASAEVSEFAKDVVASMGEGDQGERTYVFGVGTVKNIVIVLSAASSVAVLTATGLAVWGLAGAALSSPLSLVIIEATKKSKAFKDVSEPVRKLMDSLSEADGRRFRAFVEEVDGKAMTRFTLQEEDRIRRIIGDRSEYKWLHEQLDWIKANKPEDF